MNIRSCCLCGLDIDTEAPDMKIVHSNRGRVTVVDSKGVAHITKKIKPKLEARQEGSDEQQSV